MYNGRKSEDMEFYRNLEVTVHASHGAPLSDEFWTVCQYDDPDWLAVAGSNP